MGTIRTMATAAAAIVAAIILTDPLVRAEPQPAATAGAPLKLIPPPKRAKQMHPSDDIRVSHHTANRRAAAAGRLAVRARDTGHVMRGPDNIDLVARLPWWRAETMQTVHYPDQEVVSQVLATADAWFVAVTGEPPAGDDADVVAADEVNELDLTADGNAAAHEPFEVASAYAPETSDQSWLQSLLAMLGGALAAISAARFLFV